MKVKMTNKYLDVLHQAYKNSINLGLGNIEGVGSVIDDDIRKIISKVADQVVKDRDEAGIPREILIQDCGGVAAMLHANLKQHGVETLITIGDVIDRGKSRYDTTFEYLKDELKKGIQNSPVKLHVWLSMSDGTIIDPTILLKRKGNAFVNKKLNYQQQGLYIGDAISLKLKYKPVLLGSDFLYKIGLLR